MKKLVFLLVSILIPLFSHAQDVSQAPQQQPLQQLRFGVLSFDEALKSMPEYAQVQKNLASLKAKYDAEMKRSEDEFNKKYEEFLEGQRDFAPSIFQKRQAELQDMMEKNIKFREESHRLLQEAERNAYLPLRSKLSTVLHNVGSDLGFAFILNTDNDAVPFVDARMGQNIQSIVGDIVKQLK